MLNAKNIDAFYDAEFDRFLLGLEGLLGAKRMKTGSGEERAMVTHLGTLILPKLDWSSAHKQDRFLKSKNKQAWVIPERDRILTAIKMLSAKFDLLLSEGLESRYSKACTHLVKERLKRLSKSESIELITMAVIDFIDEGWDAQIMGNDDDLDEVVVYNKHSKIDLFLLSLEYFFGFERSVHLNSKGKYSYDLVMVESQKNVKGAATASYSFNSDQLELKKQSKSDIKKRGLKPMYFKGRFKWGNLSPQLKMFYKGMIMSRFDGHMKKLFRSGTLDRYAAYARPIIFDRMHKLDDGECPYAFIDWVVGFYDSYFHKDSDDVQQVLPMFEEPLYLTNPETKSKPTAVDDDFGLDDDDAISRLSEIFLDDE